MAKLKLCTKCKKEKLLSEYHRDKGQKSGLAPRCKTCKAKYMKEFRESPKGQKQKDYAKRPDIRAKNIERSREYRQSGKKAISAKKYYDSDKGRDFYLKRYHKITLKQYTEMLLDQKGVCKICGLPETNPNGRGGIKPLSVDHNHATGKIRGLLCSKCNVMLGVALDNPDILIAGIKYLMEGS